VIVIGAEATANVTGIGIVVDPVEPSAIIAL
jgi:hypothetical protein